MMARPEVLPIMLVKAPGGLRFGPSTQCLLRLCGHAPEQHSTSSSMLLAHVCRAPIMGMSYNKPVTQWSKGEYSNANNKEDDTAVSWPLQCQLSLLCAAGQQLAAVLRRSGRTQCGTWQRTLTRSCGSACLLFCFLPCMVCRS